MKRSPLLVLPLFVLASCSSLMPVDGKDVCARTLAGQYSATEAATKLALKPKNKELRLGVAVSLYCRTILGSNNYPILD